MEKKSSRYQQLLLVFQKHDVLDCYSLSFGKETYNQEVNYIIKKVKKTYNYEKVKQIVCDMFNGLLDLSEKEEIRSFKFVPEDFEKLSEDIFKVFQGMNVEIDPEENEVEKYEELQYQILILLDEMDISFEDFENSLDLGDGVDFDSLSYPELDYLVSKLLEESSKIEKKDPDDSWKAEEE
jgi:hypothetical protein